MDKTEKIVSAIPSAAELEQLAELHKAMGDHTDPEGGTRRRRNAGICGDPLASNAERILRQ